MSFVASRYAIVEADATSIAFLRYGGACLLLTGVAMAMGASLRLERRDVAPVLGLGVLMFACFGWLFTAGTEYIPAARAALIISGMPLATLAIAAAFGLERLTLPKLAACALAVAGVAIALGDRASAGPEAWKGDAILIAAAILGGFHAVRSGAYLRRYKPLPLIAIQTGAGAAALGLVLLLTGNDSALTGYSPGVWVAILWLASAGGLVSFWLWYYALERIPASNVAMTVTLNPVAAALVGVVVLDEPVGLRLLAGLACIAAAIALANRKGRA